MAFVVAWLSEPCGFLPDFQQDNAAQRARLHKVPDSECACYVEGEWTIVIPEPTHQREAAEHPQVAFADFQQLIRKMYLEKDLARGIDGTFMWFMEEVGELASALRDGSHEERMEEFADVIAWLTTMANVVGVDLSQAVTRKYGSGCPGCGHFVCSCSLTEKP